VGPTQNDTAGPVIFAKPIKPPIGRRHVNRHAEATGDGPFDDQAQNAVTPSLNLTNGVTRLDWVVSQQLSGRLLVPPRGTKVELYAAIRRDS
jgi:hypothetical protein